MSKKDILKEIKERISRTLQEYGIDKYTIYLFGSRTKGIAKEDSDFDEEKNITGVLLNDIKKEVVVL